jgi:hypothetical protein
LLRYDPGGQLVQFADAFALEHVKHFSAQVEHVVDWKKLFG